MAKPADKTDLIALRNLISEADLLLSTLTLPEGRAERARDLLAAALKLSEHLVTAPAPSAVALGKRGGLKTAERGPDYFKKIAAMRKTRAGGRPRKTKGDAR